MNAFSDEHTLDRLLDSLNRFNRQQDEPERAQEPYPALDIEPDRARREDMALDKLRDDAQAPNHSADADNLPNSTDALVSRADALMQRQGRSLTQSYTTLNLLSESSPEAAPQAQHADDFDDLPVLTDIVPSATRSNALDGLNVAEAPFTLPAAFDDEALAMDMEHLRDNILDSLRKRLDAEIPTLAEAALQNALPGIIEEIRSGLEENIHTVLSDLTQPR
ncbi:hypothetical protein FACS1894185_0660 [Betaproteobacteria bacterium]|nr:hypothetical protein FACS1894185_0660 [Betaproteobacteria bacterium]GHU14412.1 hypothetical protein FACS189441_3990 [Betaproteobacteria bacterium]